MTFSYPLRSTALLDVAESIRQREDAEIEREHVLAQAAFLK